MDGDDEDRLLQQRSGFEGLFLNPAGEDQEPLQGEVSSGAGSLLDQDLTRGVEPAMTFSLRAVIPSLPCREEPNALKPTLSTASMLRGDATLRQVPGLSVAGGFARAPPQAIMACLGWAGKAMAIADEHQ
jgi:hypothetical protein